MVALPHIDDPNNPPRLVVAMSGGVDSSVCAALCKEAGYETIGITLQLYDMGQQLARKGACCAGQDIEDAKRVAEHIGIPHYVLNYESIFKESVMEEFADSYANGETPIPCVRCNQSVKFRDLFTVAKDLGADGLVTGHYVQRHEGKAGAEMHRGADLNKDQSYFLFATTQAQLDFLHFPLGGLDKATTREHAKRLGLEIHDKPDSQDICFVAGGNYADIVKKLRPDAATPGDIVHIDGTVLGQHEGLLHYTVGQRRGLKISYHEPLYVIELDAEKQQVIVGPEAALGKRSFYIKDVNWLSHTPLSDTGTEAVVKLRSLHAGAKATLFADAKGARVVLHEAEKAVTPGQACVAYSDTHMLGGGWIMREGISN